MSFKAILKIEGAEHEVLDCSFGFHRSIDEKGQPSEEARGGTINLSVEGTGDTKFYDWVIDNWGLKSGSIVFLKRDSDATEVELEFEEGYCVSWDLNFSSANSNRPTIETLSISCKTMKFGGNEHIKTWKGV